MGERTPLALLDARAAARMAVAEALTNIAAADVADIGRVVLSANWMAACGEPGEDADLFDAVEAVAMELCPALGISIPVGKDSLSMSTTWRDGPGERKVVSPVSLVVTAFAPVEDARLSLVPMLRTDIGESSLLLVDLGYGANRLGGSALALSHQRLGAARPTSIGPRRCPRWSGRWRDYGIGGWWRRTTTAPTAASPHACWRWRSRAVRDSTSTSTRWAPTRWRRCSARSPARSCRSETPTWTRSGPSSTPSRLSRLRPPDRARRARRPRAVHGRGPHPARGVPHRTAPDLVGDVWRMQRLRDDPRCADEEYARIADEGERGLWCTATFDIDRDIDHEAAIDDGDATGTETGTDSRPGGADPDAGSGAPLVALARPRVAILREQGVNGHVEMAASFHAAGFDAFDVHMSDLASGRVSLAGFAGLAACGGFSYGDVLGAGGGLAHSIRFNPRCRDEFEAFFRRGDTFTLGVCNGCQMLALLHDLIPGADAWPRFERNRSEQFEGRW